MERGQSASQENWRTLVRRCAWLTRLTLSHQHNVTDQLAVVAQARPQLTHLVINWCKATAPTQAKLTFVPTLQIEFRLKRWNLLI
jgi:hypothetical protein